ncbi:UDP-N-acetylmuramoyl-L-alanine--D-glutamate ligase [Myxococcota bacterium]|nr:UDP-N-acetylmuramoyl-L-alanine--D-glutamate ligase [Myxococcota bacterium]
MLTDRRVVVMGMGRSGQAAALLARELGAQVITTDLRGELPAVPGCEAVHGQHREADFRQADLVVVSPGVAAAHPMLAVARQAGAQVLGELAFALQSCPGLPVLAVTGTNGKSSTTWFLGQLLEGAGRHPFVGGNIGVPLSGLALARLQGQPSAMAVDVLVLEISSYQLELPGDLAPLAGCVLNLTPDHLGRHGDMAGYAAAKRRLFERTGPQDTAWLAADRGRVQAMAPGLPCAVRWLGDHPGVTVQDDALHFVGTPDDGPVPLRELRLLGAHNRENVAAACALALSLGVPRAALDLSRLSALPHRLQLVHQAGGVRWINDSKATNVDAALVGIRAMDRPAVVLLGGLGKEGADYAPLAPALAKARAVIAFGASGSEIAATLGARRVGTMAEAVALAARLAGPGDAVLLSPACASFDEFQDFEHRGRVFADLARATSGEPQ